MKTIIMLIAIIRDGDKILLRKFDPSKNPYKEDWGLFGGSVGDGLLIESANKDFKKRWNMELELTKELWWDSETKIDHDGEEKQFIWLDAECKITEGSPESVGNPNEELRWVHINELSSLDHVPPSKKVLEKMGFL